jgi:hypothetical protein
MCLRRAWRSTLKNKLWKMWGRGAVGENELLQCAEGHSPKINCGKKAAKVFIVVDPFMLRLLERRPINGRDQKCM